MPFMNGVRVTIEQWRAHQPVRPIYILDAQGGRHLQNADALVEGEDRQTAERWAREENDRRSAGILFGVDVAPVTPDMWPGREDVTYEQVRAARDEKHRSKAEAAIAVATASTRSAQSEDADSSGSQRVLSDAGVRVRNREKFADLPPRNPNRHSQTPAGRHERYVRSQAAKWGVSDDVADARLTRHPTDCEWQAVS